MGNCCAVEGAVDHWIYVKSGDRKGLGSGASLRMFVQDVRNQQSSEIRLDVHFKNDFERGKTDVFDARSLEGFGDLTRVELWRDGSGGPADWYCEAIVVNNRRTEKCFYFPVMRWLIPGQRHKVEQFDTMLPQLDPNREQRAKELDAKRELYQYGQSGPDLPVQVSSLPADEQFSDEFKCDIINAQYQLIAKSMISRLPATPWDSLEELTNVYTPALPEPQGLDRWSNDLCFGAQRLIGCNPTMVRQCTDLPENMGVTAEMLRPFLEGWTMKQIIEAKRLFVVDLKILKNLPTINGKKLCAPIGLFFVTGDKQFVPIAIQLSQNIAPDNPVFLPNDPPFTWLLAKMWFNNSDAQVHRALSHFAFTHLLMESICVVTHRHLSTSHPIFKLLAPHFLFLPAINARGLDQLMNPGGWTDRTTTLGRDGIYELIRRGTEEWRMDVHGTFPKELESRGVLDQRILPNYSYRDDGMLLYKAIEAYVSKIIRHYYDNPDKIKEDFEIQNWVGEMSVSKEDGGAGIKGIPGQGKFRRVEEIIMVCTSIIFTCSIQHAAVNFPQYHEYAFPPNYPSVLNKTPPTDRHPRSEEDVIAVLPDKATTLEIMSMTKLFSTRPPKSLGEWEFQWQYDPFALKAEKEFKEDLRKASQIIHDRNQERDEVIKYFYLDPQNIANNICV